MMTKPLSNPLIRYRMLDILVWGLVFLLWRGYYLLTDPPQLAWIFASITTLFAAFTFYCTYYFWVPLCLSGRLWKFWLAMCCTLLVLVCLRSTLVYFSFRLVLPEYLKGWGLFRSITASSFHIIYAVTLATLIRFVLERYEAQQKLDAVLQENLRTELKDLDQKPQPTQHVPDYVFLKANGKIEKVFFDDILYIEANENYSHVFTLKGNYFTLMRLGQLEAMLDVQKFVRAHKSFILAIDKIERLDGNRVQIGEREIPLSRNIRKTLKDRLLNS